MADRRDANEREIISTLVAAGAVCIQMHRQAGFDLVVCHDGKSIGMDLLSGGRVYIVEVKSWNGKLTRNEEAARDAVELAGCTYWILRSTEDALRMLEVG